MSNENDINGCSCIDGRNTRFCKNCDFIPRSDSCQAYRMKNINIMFDDQ